MAIVPILIAQTLKPLLETEKSYLVRSGFEVVTAEDGERAVELARERHPRLILLDHDMPRMDGATACAAMRRMLQLSFTPIVIVSATGAPELRDRCVKAGCTEFVLRPERPGELLGVIARALRLRQRKATRIPVAFEVTGTLNGRRIVGTAIDMSGTGLLLLSGTTIPLLAVLHMEFILPKTDHAVKVKGKVVRAAQRANGSCEAGVHFLEMSQSNEEQILDYVSS